MNNPEYVSTKSEMILQVYPRPENADENRVVWLTEMHLRLCTELEQNHNPRWLGGCPEPELIEAIIEQLKSLKEKNEHY